MNGLMDARTTTELNHPTPNPNGLLDVSEAMMLTHLTDAVHRGAKLLDKVTPGWYRTGKLGKLQDITRAPHADLCQLAVKGTTRYYDNGKAVDGGYYGFYTSRQVLLTGQPIERNFDTSMFTKESLRLSSTLNNPWSEPFITIWKAEVKARRTAENRQRKDERIAKHGLAYEAARGRRS